MAKNKQTPDKAHLVKGSDYLISLSSIVGKKVVDVHGYVTTRFGMLNFKLVAVVFSDGTMEGIDGDLPQPAKHKELRDKNLSLIDPNASESIEYDDNDDPDDEN